MKLIYINKKFFVTCGLCTYLSRAVCTQNTRDRRKPRLPSYENSEAVFFVCSYKPPNKKFNPRYTINSKILWWKHYGIGCFLSFSVDPIHLITDIMTADTCIYILKEIMLPYAEDNMPMDISVE